MKRNMLMIVMGTFLALAIAVPACAADYIEVAGYYEASSLKNDEVLRGEAGEATVEWNVPLLPQAPTIDGVVMNAEYARFENYEDYLSLTATANIGKDSFEALYETVKGGIFDAYWGWDGQYLYLAFEVDCVNGYYCSPELDVMLFAYNCLQIGLSDVDAIGRDTSYTELGFGYDNVNNRNITFTWLGFYQSDAEDFAGSYDETTQRVTYELRIDLQQALGWEKYPENGDQCNFAFVLEIGGEDDTQKMTEILFCHGIGGQYSMKVNEYFARITFSDQVALPETTEQIPPDTTAPDMTAPEDETSWEDTQIVPEDTFPPVEIPDVTNAVNDIPEEFPTQEAGVSFGKGGLFFDFLDWVDWQGCTSVSAVSIVPLLFALGAVLLKKKDDWD